MNALILITLFVLTLFVLYRVLINTGFRQMKQEQEYDKLYKEIWNLVHDPDMNDKDIIADKLNELRKLKYKNVEKTNGISVEFLEKFYKYEDEICDFNWQA